MCVEADLRRLVLLQCRHGREPLSAADQPGARGIGTAAIRHADSLLPVYFRRNFHLIPFHDARDPSAWTHLCILGLGAVAGRRRWTESLGSAALTPLSISVHHPRVAVGHVLGGGERDFLGAVPGLGQPNATH